MDRRYQYPEWDRPGSYYGESSFRNRGANGDLRNSYDEKPREDKVEDEGKYSGPRSALSHFAENTGIGGIPHINRSKRWITKLYWFLCFSGCLFMIIFQGYFVLVKFLSHPFTTQVTLKHSTVDFPTVTLCNLNPVRASQYQKAPAIAELVNKLINGSSTEINPSYIELAEQAAAGGSTAKKRKKRSLQTEPVNDSQTPSGLNDVPFFSRKSVNNHREKRFVDGFDHDGHDYDYDNDDEGGVESSYKKLLEAFRSAMGQTSIDLRKEIGHKKEDSILYCSYNGYDCSHSNFTTISDDVYGNCWSFNLVEDHPEPLRVAKSGPVHGLQLILYKQDVEYINGLVQGGGFRLTINAHNTMSLPADAGIFIPTGFHTDVTMRLLDITRLGEPYATCGSDKKYEDLFNREYTEQLCSHSCADRFIAETCKCYRSGYRIFYSTDELNTLPTCSDSATTKTCMTGVVDKYVKKTLTCDCPQACREKIYETQLSMYNWPDIGYQNTIVNLLCSATNAGEDCLQLVSDVVNETMDVDLLLNTNFASLNIYFNNLNYQVVTQEPSYGLPQFASDIGGALGLWLGLPVFFFAELLWLAVLLFRVAMNSCKRKQSDPPRRNKVANLRPQTGMSSPAYQHRGYYPDMQIPRSKRF